MEQSNEVIAKEEPYDDHHYDYEMSNVNPQFSLELKDEPVDSLEVAPTDNQITNHSSATAKVEPFDDYDYDYEMFNTNPQFPIEPKDEAVDSMDVGSSDNQITFDTTSSGELQEEKEVAENIPRDSMRDDSVVKEDEEMNDELIDHSKDRSKKPIEVKKRTMPSRSVSKPLNYTDSVEDSGDDSETEMKKKPRSDSQKKNYKKRTSVVKKHASNLISKNPRVARVNKTELECPKCEFRTRSVNYWTKHLKLKHFTTPLVAGLALRCECGLETFSDRHIGKCKFANFTVVHKGYETLITPECILCEAYPKTAFGYAVHLRMHHHTTLKKNNIYLKCSCGTEVFSEGFSRITHGKECDHRLFTLHKLDE